MSPVNFRARNIRPVLQNDGITTYYCGGLSVNQREQEVLNQWPQEGELPRQIETISTVQILQSEASSTSSSNSLASIELSSFGSSSVRLKISTASCSLLLTVRSEDHSVWHTCL